MVTAELVNNIETISWGQGRKYALLYISTIVCLMLSLYFCKIFACRMARNVNYQLKSDLVEHVLNMKQNDFYKEEKSFYVSLATEDSKNAYYSYYECVIEGVTSAINLVIYSILMLRMNWIMGMVIIICCLFCMLVPEIAGERLSKLNMEFLKKHGEHIGILTELFDGFVLVNRRTRKAFSKLHSNICRERENALYLLNSFKALVDTVSGSCTYIINIAAFICGIILLNNKMIQVGQLLREKGVTVATAESCTGGEIAHLLTSVPGSSDYFKGSVVAYANEVKVNVLGVNPADIEREGVVSEPVVLQMAEGVRRVMGTDYAVATSGVAGPAGGTPEKPVGTVWIGVATPRGCFARKYVFSFTRERNIAKAAAKALELLSMEMV